MADAKKDREKDLEEVIERIRHEIWKPKQTLPALRRAVALILQDLKLSPWQNSKGK